MLRKAPGLLCKQATNPPAKRAIRDIPRKGGADAEVKGNAKCPRCGKELRPCRWSDGGFITPCKNCGQYHSPME